MIVADELKLDNYHVIINYKQKHKPYNYKWLIVRNHKVGYFIHRSRLLSFRE